MGTEKYPDENEYQKFIEDNGGQTNAYTSLTDTNYMFEIATTAFPEALERFSQFFYAPLMKQDSVDREINAVDSEHKNNLQTDLWRFYQLV